MEHDLVTARYLSDNERYADLLNGYGFGGAQIISAEDLSELDSRTGLWQKKRQAGAADKGKSLLHGQVAFNHKGRKQKAKYRDLIRKVAFGVNFAVIGIENQEEVHYLMPLRVMSYDAAEYERQASAIKKKVRKMKGINKAEFLSGFLKESRLQPCVTLVLYYGKDWDGAKNLLELLDFTGIPKELQELVNDYPIHLLEIRKIEDTSVFKTDLKQVFDFIRCSEDENKLRELVERDEAFHNMDEDAYDMAVSYTKATELIEQKKYHEKGGKVDMCKALTDMLQTERTIGREEGIEQGIRALILDNLEEGKSAQCIMEKLVKRFELTEDKATEYLEKYNL